MRPSYLFMIIGAVCIGILIGQIPRFATANAYVLIFLSVIAFITGMVASEVEKEEVDNLHK